MGKNDLKKKDGINEKCLKTLGFQAFFYNRSDVIRTRGLYLPKVAL